MGMTNLIGCPVAVTLQDDDLAGTVRHLHLTGTLLAVDRTGTLARIGFASGQRIVVPASLVYGIAA